MIFSVPAAARAVANRDLPGALTLLASAALVIAIFAFRDLPMVDLPQHAAQIAAWLHWNDPLYKTHELELNFRTPYLLAYPLARLLAPLFGPVGALKIVVAAALLAHVAAFAHLVRRLGHDRWLVLLGVPTALGYAFCFGFVSFLVAVPLVFLAIALAHGHAESPSPKVGSALAACLSLILVAHGVALALALIATTPLLLRGGRSLFARAWPLLVPILLGALWILPGSATSRIGDTYWEVGPSRLKELPGMLAGIGAADPLASTVGLGLLMGTAMLVGRPSRRPEHWVPLAATFAGFMFFPTLFRGVGPLSPRFSILVVPALLLAFEPVASDARRVRLDTARTGLAFVSVAWIALWILRLPAYNRETAGLHALVDRMPRGLDIRPIVFERDSTAFPGVPALLHLPAYYQVRKGGTQGYSFAMYPISVIRYRPGVTPRMGGGAEWSPETFDGQREAGLYDYYIVHSTTDLSTALFGRETPLATLEAREGRWWAYRAKPDALPSSAFFSSRTE